MKILTSQDQGQTLRLGPGECFLLVLRNPGAGGYVIDEFPEFDSQILTLEKLEKKIPSDPSREGDFGNLEWTFRAREEGFSVIIVRAFRPWESGKEALVIFEAQVHVTH